MAAKIIKITLSILLFICLAKLPYGYYELVRFCALVGFAILAYYANENGNKTETVVFIALAILFQPFLKIALGRNLWNIIDGLVALGLLLSIALLIQNKNNEEKNS